MNSEGKNIRSIIASDCDLLSMEAHQVFLEMTSREGMTIQRLAEWLGSAWPTVGEWQRAYEGDTATGKPSPLEKLNRIRQHFRDQGDEEMATLPARWLAARDGYDLVRKIALPADVDSLRDEIISFTKVTGEFQTNIPENDELTREEISALKVSLRKVREQASRIEAALLEIGAKKRRAV